MKCAIAFRDVTDSELQSAQVLKLCDTLFCRPSDKHKLSEYKEKTIIIDNGSIHTGYGRVESLELAFTYPGTIGILLSSAEEIMEIERVSDRPVYSETGGGMTVFPYFLVDCPLNLMTDTIGNSVTESTSNEMGFLSVCKRVLKEGEQRDDRTGVGTLSLFSPPVIHYDLSNGKIPCFTTKRVPWKSTIKELLWFISGDTDSRPLEQQGVNWWVGNTSREFLDNRGLDQYDLGELGPLYGWQWRRAGAKYVPGTLRSPDCGHGEGGYDQLEEVIHQIKTNPHSRRLIVSSYIPQDLEKAVLPPCHSFFQFYVDKNGLSCTLYQRSADMFLGAQINVLSYSILTHMIASLCGLKAYRFYHHIGDAHIYINHITQMTEQFERPIQESPTITINGGQTCIDDFVLEDFSVNGYSPAKSIKAPMAV